MAYTIAVANQKGGVAKTTSALSLGACWAEAGKRVLVVDGDAQANLTAGCGIEVGDLEASLYEVLTGDRTAVDVLQPTEVAGLTLLPASPDLTVLQAELAARPGYERTLQRRVASCAAAFDLMVIDCPPSIGFMTINALTAADLVLIPVQCEYYAARGLTQILQIIRLVREYTNPALQAKIAITMYDKRTRAARIMLDEVRGAYAADVCDQVIGVDARLKMSQIVGRPITRYARRTRATAQYRALAEEVLNGTG